jgi:Tol biopolymer transport system component
LAPRPTVIAMKTVVLAALVALMVACSGCGGSGPASGHGILFIRQAHSSASWDPQGPVYIWRHGSSPRQLSQSEDAKDRPQWSPDGRLIAYTAIEGWNGEGACQAFACKFEIWVMRSDGSDSKQLTTEGEPNSIGADAPSWSPDGKRIVYVRILASSPTQLAILTLRNRHVRPLHLVGENPAWGKPGIAYVSRGPHRGGIWLVDPSTGVSRRFATSRYHYEHGAASVLAWSSRGMLAALATSHGQRVLIYSSAGQLVSDFRIPRDGQACDVSWSPDGTRLILDVIRSGVYEVDRSGGAWRRLPIKPTTCSTSWR